MNWREHSTCGCHFLFTNISSLAHYLNKYAVSHDYYSIAIRLKKKKVIQNRQTVPHEHTQQLKNKVFVTSKDIKVEVRVIRGGWKLPSSSADCPYQNLDYSGYHKNKI